MGRRIIVLLGALTMLLAACSSDSGTSRSTQTSTTTAPHDSSTPAPTSTTGARQVAVQVYFARSEKVATAGRSVTAPAVARGALDALLDGPDSFERGLGMESAIPAGTKLRGIDISNGLATVDLTGEFQSGGGSLSMSLRVAQVVFTLTQFPTVERVTIHIDGRAVAAVGGEGVPARNLTRADEERVTPLVLVESPVPGATVSSPLTVSGTSNTFEATVNYTITDPEGLILAEGHATATAGNGTWGTFRFTASFTTTRSGLGTVLAYEIDPQTGNQQHVYEVPVRMG
jgi:Immunoglobulin-like domain of bacterial spore germination/Sporulation and spore germination